MTTPPPRKILGLVLLAAVAVMAFAYAFAAYLIYRKYQPLRAPQAAQTPRPGAKDLLAVADDQLKNRKVEQALVSYREALSQQPQSIAAQLGLARGEFAAGREQVAAREFERVLKLDPNNKSALLELARIYSHQAKTWPESEIKYAQYSKLAPDDADALLGMARVLAWQGKSEPAAGLFARTDVSRLMTIADQRDYASALVKLGRGQQAEPLLKKLLASFPNDLDLKLQLAGVYAARKDWNSALPLYKAALAKRPYDPQLNLTYGLGLLSTRQYKAALPPLQRARNAMPSSGEAGLACARALKGSGDLKKALREYERVLPRYSRNASITREYADALLEKRDYKKSAQYYGTAYGLGLRDERILLGLAGAYSGQGKYKEALPYLEELYRREPTQRVTFELARVMAKLGKNDRARQLLRQVQEARR